MSYVEINTLMKWRWNQLAVINREKSIEACKPFVASLEQKGRLHLHWIANTGSVKGLGDLVARCNWIATWRFSGEWRARVRALAPAPGKAGGAGRHDALRRPSLGLATTCLSRRALSFLPITSFKSINVRMWTTFGRMRSNFVRGRSLIWTFVWSGINNLRTFLQCAVKNWLCIKISVKLVDIPLAAADPDISLRRPMTCIRSYSL